MTLKELKKLYAQQLHSTEKLSTQRRALFDLLDVAGIDYSKEKVQTSPKDKNAEIMAEIVELEDEINISLQKCKEIQDEIIRQVEKCSDEKVKTILLDRYLLNMQWQDIADEVNYCYGSTLRKAKQGLDEIKVKADIENETLLF